MWQCPGAHQTSAQRTAVRVVRAKSLDLRSVSAECEALCCVPHQPESLRRKQSLGERGGENRTEEEGRGKETAVTLWSLFLQDKNHVI